MDQTNNSVELCGTLAARPVFSHSGRNEDYYIFPLDVERLSGTVDTINVIARKRLLEQTGIPGGGKILVTGELRSFNNKNGEGSRLVITVFAREIAFTDGEDRNEVRLVGTLCKPPNFRKTPMGREICDIMLAVNRRYRRSDYLPCIAWGQLAQLVSELYVGDVISLRGRIQSRKYIKTVGGEVVEKTAFEVSAVDIDF